MRKSAEITQEENRMRAKTKVKGREYSQVMAIVMLLAAMALAGSSVVVGKVLVATIPVFAGTFASLVVAFICMLPLMRGRYDEVRALTRRQWGYLFLQGLCGIVLFRVFALYGLKSTGAMEAGIITGTTPAVLALLAIVLLGERLSMKSLVAVMCSVAGCVVINLSQSGEGESTLQGCLLVGAAVFCEALFTIWRKRIADTVSATTNTTVLIFCSLLLLAVPAGLEMWSMSVLPDRTAVAAVVYYGVFATVLAYLLWTSAVGRVSGATAGVTTAAMPASAVVLGCLFLGESVNVSHLLGCLFVVTGIIVSTVSTVPNRLLRQEVVIIGEDIGTGDDADHLSFVDNRQIADVLFDHDAGRHGR